MAAKKKFFEVELPIINKKVRIIGENLENLNKRRIKLDLTRELRGKSLEAVFEVKATEKKAQGEPIKIEVFKSFLRRMMRKSVNYVEDSFIAESKDNQLRIKFFLIARKKVVRKVRKALRDKAREWIIQEIKKKKTEDIFAEIIHNKLQKTLNAVLKKIYPLSLCEIKHISLVGEKKKTEPEKKEKKLEIKEEKIEDKPKEPITKKTKSTEKKKTEKKKEKSTEKKKK